MPNASQAQLPVPRAPACLDPVRRRHRRERIRHPDLVPVEDERVRVVQPPPAREHVLTRAELLRARRPAEADELGVRAVAKVEVDHGSVWTMISEIAGQLACGCAPRSRSPARAPPRAAAVGVEPEGEEDDAAPRRSAGTAARAAACRSAPGRSASPPPRRARPRPERRAPPPPRPAARGASARRPPPAAPPRSPARPRSRRACASSSESSPGQLQVQRDLGAPVDVEDADVVDLAHARHAHRRGVGELARDGVLLGGLDVDDDVGLRQRALDRLLDRVGGRVPLPDRCVGRDRDHDVGEVAPRRRAHPQPAQADGGSIARDRPARRLLGVRRRAVHQHVDVPPHQPQGGAQHERRDEQRGDRVARRPARRARSRGRRARRASPAKSLPKCSAFERSAALSKRRAVRSEIGVRVDVDREHEPDDDEGPPARVDRRSRSSRRAARRRGRRPRR